MGDHCFCFVELLMLVAVVVWWCGGWWVRLPGGGITP